MVERGEKRTKELDRLAMHYLLFYIAAPLFIIYSTYYASSNRSIAWADGVLEFLNNFGCIFAMGTQIYINYHMDMVNHVSMRSIVYKLANFLLGK